MAESTLSISAVSRRSGLAPSALRYYEDAGIVTAERDHAGRRQYPRSVLRRLAFVRAAQQVGLSLDEIRAALATLPDGRTPTKADWARISRLWRPRLDARIAELVALRDRLDSCIGCGCLSLRTCRLSNPDDVAGHLGSGARYLLGDAVPSATRRRTTARVRDHGARA
ncbi:MAG TPA: redox-sensitive transcriptional activator SoxR [Kineosporiaceae bacterium]